MTNPSWKVSSILCLEDNHAVLYVELIQLLAESDDSSVTMAWLRPFAIQIDMTEVPVHVAPHGDRHPEADAIVFDARNTADLIWPIHLFRPGLDTEVISIMAMLPYSSGITPSSPEKRETSRQLLNQFLHRIWTTHKHDFPASGTQPPYG